MAGDHAHRFVFVGGLHRSGTSLITQWLALHPAVSRLTDTGVSEDEGQHLQGVYPAAIQYGGPGRFAFAREMHITEKSPLVTEENRRQILAAWQPYWELECSVLVEKSPPNLLKMRFLQAMFPEARFIIALRHPVVTAYATRKWRKTTISRLVKHWLICHEIMARDLQFVRQWTLVRYEDLMAYPEEEVMRLQEFIGVEPWRNAGGFKPRLGLNEMYLERWSRGYRGMLNGLGGPLGFANVARRFEQRVKCFGYSLDHPEELAERQWVTAQLAAVN